MTALADLKPRVRVAAGRSALLTSAAMPTVQFRGIGAAGKKPAADDDDNMTAEEREEAKKKAEEQAAEDDAKAKAAEKEKAKKAREKAARERGDTPADPDEDDDNDDEGNDDSDSEDMKGGKKAAHARLRERSRIAAILESPAAAANLDYAVKVALTTDLTRSQAIALLQAAPKPNANGGRLADRMADYGAQRPGPGAAPIPKGQAAIDALWDSRAAANGLIPTRR